MKEISKLSKEDMLKYTGCIPQVAGIQKFMYTDGMSRGIPAVSVKTGSGLAFTVLEGRNMDLYNFEYKGINFAFYYKNGLVSPERVSFADGEFLGQGSGGMMYTSGLLNSGPPNTDDGMYYPLHGRIYAMGAENTSAIAEYDENGEYVIELKGKSREARLFAHNLTLSRSIKTKLNSKTIEITDYVENETCRDTLYSVLYHINLGYPFLDDGCEIVIPGSSSTSARTEASKEYYDERFKITAPIDNFTEHLYFHELPKDKDGLCHSLVINPGLKLALKISYAKSTLPYLAQWKSMGSGDYALGIMPSTTVLRGRNEEKAAGAMSTVKAFSKEKLTVSITVLDDMAEIEKVKAEIQNM